MPATLPAHPAAVIPLKLRLPHRFDGVALVAGSIAPDLAYALLPRWDADAHSLAALAYWSVPVAVLLTVILRRLVLPAAALAPDLGALHLRDAALRATARHSRTVTGVSAAIGAATHLVWDYPTHLSGAAAHWPALAAAPLGVPWYKLLQYASGLTGTIVTVACAFHIGRRRLLRRWTTGPHPSVPARRAWWFTAVTVGVPLAAAAVLAPGAAHPHILAARGILAAIAACATATLLARASARAPA